MMKRFLTILCALLFIGTPVGAVTIWITDSNGVALTAFTGGTAGCLDQIDGDLLNNGDRAEVIWDAGNYLVTAKYRLNTSSSASESGIENITPDTNAGTKRWEVTQPPFCFGTTAPTNPETWLLWVDTTP